MMKPSKKRQRRLEARQRGCIEARDLACKKAGWDTARAERAFRMPGSRNAKKT